MSDLDDFFSLTGASPDTAAAASAGSFPIPLPLKKSSCIAMATYSPRDGVLAVTFGDGKEANHQTDLVTILRWLVADSVGRFYNSEIKGQ
jgi:KTSC domain